MYIHVYSNIIPIYIIYIYLHILTMSWNRPPPSQGLRFIFTLRLHREPTNSQTLVSSVTMVLTPAWTKRLKHTLGTTGERCWVLGVDAGKSFLGQGVIPPLTKNTYQHHINTHQSVEIDKWNKQHPKTCVTKLMEEAAFAFSRLTFLTLTTDGLRKKALEKGWWLFLGSMFQSVNRFTLSCTAYKALSFPNKLLIVTHVFLSDQFLLFLNVTH